MIYATKDVLLVLDLLRITAYLVNKGISILKIIGHVLIFNALKDNIQKYLMIKLIAYNVIPLAKNV